MISKVISIEIIASTDIMNQVNLTGIYRPFHPNIKECTSQHVIDLPTKLSTYYDTKQDSTKIKKIEITLFIISDHH